MLADEIANVIKQIAHADNEPCVEMVAEGIEYFFGRGVSVVCGALQKFLAFFIFAVFVIKQQPDSRLRPCVVPRGALEPFLGFFAVPFVEEQLAQRIFGLETAVFCGAQKILLRFGGGFVFEIPGVFIFRSSEPGVYGFPKIFHLLARRIGEFAVAAAFINKI